MNPKFELGQKVVLFNKHSGGYPANPRYKVGVVERITRTQITVDGQNYMKNNGRRVGANILDYSILYDPRETTGLMSIDKIDGMNAVHSAKAGAQ